MLWTTVIDDQEDIEDVRLKWHILPAPPVFGAKHRSMSTPAEQPAEQDAADAVGKGTGGRTGKQQEDAGA